MKKSIVHLHIPILYEVILKQYPETRYVSIGAFQYRGANAQSIIFVKKLDPSSMNSEYIITWSTRNLTNIDKYKGIYDYTGEVYTIPELTNKIKLVFEYRLIFMPRVIKEPFKK